MATIPRDGGRTTSILTGPALLVKRRVLEAIGHGKPLRASALRQRRLALLARRHGFEAAPAHDLFLHLDGGRWNLAATQARVASSGDPASAAVVAGAAVGKRRARVCLTIIAKNEQENLPICLASAADLFDDVVVCDSGSTDQTREVARAFGARVIDIPCG